MQRHERGKESTRFEASQGAWEQEKRKQARGGLPVWGMHTPVPQKEKNTNMYKTDNHAHFSYVCKYNSPRVLKGQQRGKASFVLQL